MAKGRARFGALSGIFGAGALLALGLADCAEPTQIEIDVRSDACGVLKNAGIAVTTPDRIDSAELSIFTPERPDDNGCEAKPADRVGTLVVYPSGEKDAEVGIRIVGGVGRTAQECKPGDYAGCIVARRIERFVPGSTKKVIVILSRACVGKDCGLGKECDQGGTCVVNGPDGGTSDGGSDDAQTQPDASVDAPPDVIADAGGDACSSCVGGPATTCNGGDCRIDCSGGACSGKAVCAPGLTCTMDCEGMNACSNVSCAPGSNGCIFECNSAGNPACADIDCSGNCLVKCSNDGRCGNTITLNGDAGMTCTGPQACPSGSTVNCTGGRCSLDCTLSCPGTRNCNDASATCIGDWN